MTFKITAEEKRMILDRRKKNNKVESYTISASDLKEMASEFQDEIEDCEPWDWFESTAGGISDGNIDTGPVMKNAINMVFGITDHLIKVLQEINRGKTARFERPLRNINIKL